MSADSPSRSARRRQDLLSTTNDRRLDVDRGVAGHHPDVLGAEVLTEREEFFTDERLDRRGIIGALAAREREEVHREPDERLARSCRCIQHDVMAREDLEDRLFLGRVQLQAALGGPAEEGVEEIGLRVGVEPVGEVRDRVDGLRGVGAHRIASVSGSCGSRWNVSAMISTDRRAAPVALGWPIVR